MKAARYTLAVALATLFLLSCSLEEPAEADARTEALPTAVFLGFRREEVVEGLVTFVAEAGRAEYFDDQGLLVVYGLRFEDRGDDGSTVVTSGEADKVVYHEDTGDAEFSGSVKIHSVEENASFETDFLKYASATETIEGAPGAFVDVRVGTSLILRGAGFFADIQSKAFSFREGAQGVLSVDTSSGSAKGVRE